jgi:hypothetical protein
MKKLNLNKDSLVKGIVTLLGLILVVIGIFLNKVYVDTLFVGAGITLILAVIGDYIINFVSNKINV